MTLTELQEKLTEVDEITLMELLNVSSEDLVERFVDVIEDKFDTLVQEYGE
jgi:hypothetical protein